MKAKEETEAALLLIIGTTFTPSQRHHDGLTKTQLIFVALMVNFVQSWLAYLASVFLI